MMHDIIGMPEEAFKPDPLGRIKLFKGGSSAPSNTTSTVTNKTELPAEAKPLMTDMLGLASQLSQQPYQAYTGDRIAGLTPEHTSALDMTTMRALEGSPAINAAQSQAANTFNDYYLNQGVDLANQANPYKGQANPYMGDNPYLDQMIGRAQSGITDRFSDTVNPQLQALDRASGAFGNSGVGQTREKAYETLAGQLADTENQMRFQNYAQSGQFAEGGLNRDAQLAQNQMNNMLNTYTNERMNQMGMTEFAPQLAETDYRDAQALLGVGDIYRDESQQNLNYLYVLMFRL